MSSQKNKDGAFCSSKRASKTIKWISWYLFPQRQTETETWNDFPKATQAKV